MSEDYAILATSLGSLILEPAGRIKCDLHNTEHQSPGVCEYVITHENRTLERVIERMME